MKKVFKKYLEMAEEYKHSDYLYTEDRRNMLPKTFEQWTIKNFGSLDNMALNYGFEYDFMYPWLADEIKNADDLKEAQLKEFYNNQDSLYDDLMWKYKKMSFPMIVYRVIGLKAKSIEEISNIEIGLRWKKNIGIYWTDGGGDLESYWSEGGNDFTLKAEIYEKDINWEDTLYNNMSPYLGEDESEIQLIFNTKIKLIGIAEGKSVYDKDFEKLNIMVKA